MSTKLEKIPRGFTRYYVLFLLNEKRLTGKEIIDLSSEKSDGSWNPSPGLIYPLLGRLVRDGLVAELDDGKYTLTEAGKKELGNHSTFQEQIESQYNLMNKLGISTYSSGSYLADSALERITNVTAATLGQVKERSDSVQQRFIKKYRQFLISELERLGELDAN